MVRVTVSGACLASLLQSVYSSQCPCDGLIYGSFTTRVSSTVHDSTEEVEKVHEEICVLEYATPLMPFSFFDNVGNIVGSKLQALSSACPHVLIGWFSFFPGTNLAPSIREQAVHACLASSMRSQSSTTSTHLPIFLKIGTSTTHHGATLGISYKMHLTTSSSTMLHPVELSISNLSTKLGGQEYNNFAHSTASLFMTPYLGSSSASGSGQADGRADAGRGMHQGKSGLAGAQRRVQAALDASKAGVVALQGGYEEMLQQMQGLSRAVAEEQGRLASLGRERDMLLKLLGS